MPIFIFRGRRYVVLAHDKMGLLVRRCRRWEQDVAFDDEFFILSQNRLATFRWDILKQGLREDAVAPEQAGSAIQRYRRFRRRNADGIPLDGVPSSAYFDPDDDSELEDLRREYEFDDANGAAEGMDPDEIDWDSNSRD